MIRLEAKPEALELELDKTALVAVDMQNAFAKEGGFMDLRGFDISGTAAVVETACAVLDAARAADLRIVYTQHTYSADLLNGGGPESPNYQKEPALRLMRERSELHGKLLVEETWDWQIIDEMTPRPEDLVIRKARYSGFAGTELEARLHAEGIRYLLFLGLTTNVCVESTARDAYFREFWPILVEDAMNHAGPDFCRESTLWNFEHVFGWVTTSSAVHEALGAESPPGGSHSLRRASTGSTAPARTAGR